jgi:hypothetical protein
MPSGAQQQGGHHEGKGCCGQIYQGAGGDLRLQVWPPSASDRGGVFAYASCLNIDS